MKIRIIKRGSVRLLVGTWSDLEQVESSIRAVRGAAKFANAAEMKVLTEEGGVEFFVRAQDDES